MSFDVTVLGSGSPIPQLDRSGPSFALDDGRGVSLIDCGPGALRQMMCTGVDIERSTRVFLTHLHSDHTLGLGQFALGGWTLGRRELTVYGPAGTARLCRLWFDEILGEDIAYRAGLGRPTGGLADIASVDCRAGQILVDDVMSVSAADGVHTAPDLAYRFDIDSHSAVFTGDTAPTGNIARLASGADVLFHESNLVPSVRDSYAQTEGGLDVWDSLQNHHTRPEEAGAIAREAGVRLLVLIHFLPGVDTDSAVELARREFDGDVVAAEDGMTITVGDQIVVSPTGRRHFG